MEHCERRGITRRRFAAACAASALAAPLLGQSQAVGYREYARCLPDYLRTLAADAYARRSRRIAALKTPAEIRKYQAWARATFWKLAGGMPERTPLDTRVVGAFDRTGYRVEKLVYESRPGFFITANLYLPEGRGGDRLPGVLFQMGHAADGKGSGLYQRCCQGLARLGYVVLAFDPMGQGERTNYPRPGSWLTRFPVDDEHTVPGRQMLLVGDTASRMQVWDAVRSLDVLASHPRVDAKRLASTGQSGGGTLTMMLAAVDDRLAAAAVCSGNTENVACRPFYPPGSTDDAEQDFIGSAPLSFDRWDLLWPFAPKPLMVATSARDFFGTYSHSYESSGREEYAKLAHAYSMLDASARLEHVETPLPHGLSYSFRVAVYNWFERWLKPGGRIIKEEPPTEPESEETLWCGKTGSVVHDFGSKTPFELTRERAASIATPAAVSPAELRKLLAIEPAGAEAQAATLGRVPYRDCDVLAIEVNSAEKVWVPAWLFLPRSSWTRLLLMVEPSGRNVRWREGDLYSQLAASGTAVCAMDVRGIGDLRPEFSPGASGYARSHEDEENYAWSSLIFGRSLLGQRAVDIAAVARALARRYPQASIVLAARDAMTVPALCAGAIEPRIGELYLAGHLISWRSIVEIEAYKQPFANFVPDALRFMDLPEIARSMAPRKVVVAGCVDGAGRPVPIGRSPYAFTRDASPWDFETLSRA